MIRLISSLFIIISCSSAENSLSENVIEKTLCNDSLSAASPIKVKYLIQPMAPPMDSLHSKKVLQLTGTLMNVSNDTLCYLTLSCGGTQRLVVCDSNILENYPFLHCNVVFVQKDTLFPKSTKTFKGQFLVLKDTSHFRLGFALFNVPKEYIVKSDEFVDLYQTRNTTKILCSEHTTIINEKAVYSATL